MPNVIVTPHRSGSIHGYFERAAEFFAENLQRYVRDEPLSERGRARAGLLGRYDTAAALRSRAQACASSDPTHWMALDISLR